MSTARTRFSWRLYGLHAVRVALFVAILVLIHLQYDRLRQREVPVTLDSIELSVLQALDPAARSIDDSPTDAGGYFVLNEQGQKLGYIIQTSPESDSSVGFSGPTNMLLLFSMDDRLLNLIVLSSADTPAHIEQVKEAEHFFDSFIGHSPQELGVLTDIDGVSGATLTCLAIQEGIIKRLGGSTASLRFPKPITLKDISPLFPGAFVVKQEGDSPYLWTVRNQRAARLGTVLRTSPAADSTIGYQGPTDTFIAFNNQQEIIGIRLGKTYDNREYVDYVRKDEYFQSLFNDLSLAELSDLDLKEAEVEGTSGATMTSMAVARGLLLAAESELKQQATATSKHTYWKNWSSHDVGTTIVIVLALLIGLTRLRGQKHIRLAFPLVLVIYLGFINGDMLSLAMIAGWTRHGIPWAITPGLVLLSIAAFILPITTRNNLYCHHICPHGAAQQLLRKVRKKRLHLSPRLSRTLKLLPGLLLIICVLISMTSTTFSLVDLEPFDAWVFQIAGWATLTIAVVGLFASLFIPMAYCKYGCPTGALLNFLRLNAHSDRWNKTDWIASGLVIVALVIFQFS